MIIGQIKEGIVLDHITAGRGHEISKILHLDELDCVVATIKNADSNKMGKKDIIKIGEIIELNLDVLGYIDPGITVNIIKDGKRVKREKLKPPVRLIDVIHCKNPRCITSVERELHQEFRLTDPENRTYCCIYCDAIAK